MDKLLQLLGTRDTDKIIAYIKSNPEVMDKTDKTGATGFMQILYHRLPEVVKVAQKLKSSFTYDESIAIGRIKEVKKAINDNEEYISAFLKDGFTPIGLATFFGQDEVAHLLFDNGADPSICADNAMKVNAIHAATATGNFRMLELFLSNGYDPNIPQMNNITPVQSAAYQGNFEMVKLLVRHGADPKIKSVDDVDAIGYAKEGGHDNIVMYLKSLKKED